MSAVVSAVTAPVVYTGRIALKLEQLLDELIQTVRVVRPLATTLAKAIDDGVLEDVLAGVQQLQDATELLTTATGQLERITDVTGLVTSLPGVKQVRNRITPKPRQEADQLLFEA